MQSNEKFDTYLPNNGNWITIHLESGKTICSKHIENIINSMKMQLETFVSLLSNSEEGKWPALIGGQSFKLTTLDVSPDVRMHTLIPATSSDISELLTDVMGDEIFLLITYHGRILSMSEEAVALFGNKEDLTSLFDVSSSGAIQSALKKCIKDGSAPNFLVGNKTGTNGRANYSLSLRTLPSPGRLIFCRLEIPSVAVVTRSLDRRGLIGVLLEESFCPAIIINAEGTVTSMNEIARGVCQQMWGTNPTGSSLFEFVHPDHRKTIELRHRQRNRGYTTTSRFSVRMLPSLSGSQFVVDISVVPIPDTDQYVIFARTKTASTAQEGKTGEPIPPNLMKLLIAENIAPSEVLEITTGFLGANSAAFVHEGEILTVGDSRSLIPILDPVQLAASVSGFREDGLLVHRIHSGFSISHIVFQGIEKKTLDQLSLAVLQSASRILGEWEALSALKSGHRVLSTVKILAESFLRKTEPLEGLLSDLVKECRAETAVVFKVNQTGTALKGIGSSGVVGMLPDLQIEALNTASWACLRGETAFFAETPEDDLRFSPVFPNSRSELAVPFFKGSTTDGVILLASTETEAFHYVETEMIQLMAILFTSPASSNEKGQNAKYTDGSTASLKKKTIDHIIHEITALTSATEIAIRSIDETGDDLLNKTESAVDSIIKLGFFSRWTLWWLNVSLYNGTPDHRWIDPVPLLRKVLNDFRRISDPRGLVLNFHPPQNDIEVCTDGSFVSMIAYSLLMCILEYCKGCSKADLAIERQADHWTIRLSTSGGSIPASCLAVGRHPEKENMAFSIAWKLTEELGGTVSTFSNEGKATKMIIRLKVSG